LIVPFLDVLDGRKANLPPVWLMRQAGRYLPEYRQVREKTGSFWDLCNTPALAAEVTMQPIHRYGFEAAIVFSDILVLALALGHKVVFEDGPKLEALRSADELERNNQVWLQRLSCVYETIRLVRAQLKSDTALLGFAGAPWTLATYMSGGSGARQGNKDNQMAAKFWSYRNPASFQDLIDVISDCVAEHLIAQLKAGADAVQIFDSWASGLPPRLFTRWVVAPTAAVVAKVRGAVPGARIIGFPRGASQSGYEEYLETGVTALSLDPAIAMSWAVEKLGKRVVLQGNLDPLALVAGGWGMREAVQEILTATRETPFIFNLGHGVLPGTPVDNVKRLLKMVRGGAP
jgi:uroporphyrinogen decarboxylase